MDAEVSELVTTVERLMSPYTGTWALCGGWAVDSWLNRVTREHEDIDIAVFMDEQSLFHVELANWRLVAHETEESDHQVLWDGHSLAPATHVHAGQDLVPRRELHLNERDRGEGTWLLRRFNGAAATLPLHRFALQSPWGLPTLAPETLLFYKLTDEQRPRDEQDIAALTPILDSAQRSWLRSAIEQPVPWAPGAS